MEDYEGQHLRIIESGSADELIMAVDQAIQEGWTLVNVIWQSGHIAYLSKQVHKVK